VSQSLHREIATSIARNLVDEYGDERWVDICMGVAWFLAGVGTLEMGPTAIDAISAAARSIMGAQPEAARSIMGAQHKDRLQ
jgi:hypothetical protein